MADSDAWLAMLDGVGIITDRAVLIGQFSVEQNMAMPFTLEIDPVAADVRPRVAALADAVGLVPADLTTRIAEAGGDVQARVRVARALALEPRVLLAEHPTAGVAAPRGEAFRRGCETGGRRSRPRRRCDHRRSGVCRGARRSAADPRAGHRHPAAGEHLA